MCVYTGEKKLFTSNLYFFKNGAQLKKKLNSSKLEVESPSSFVSVLPQGQGQQWKLKFEKKGTLMSFS